MNFNIRTIVQCATCVSFDRLFCFRTGWPLHICPSAFDSLNCLWHLRCFLQWQALPGSPGTWHLSEADSSQQKWHSGPKLDAGLVIGTGLATVSGTLDFKILIHKSKDQELETFYYKLPESDLLSHFFKKKKVIVQILLDYWKITPPNVNDVVIQ